MDRSTSLRDQDTKPTLDRMLRQVPLTFTLAFAPALEVPRLTIRPARVSDVPGIQQEIQVFADQGLMIRRSLAELYQSIREFLVAVDDENRVVGCVALHVFWEDLAEIRCLAVAEHVKGLGIGRRLVDACWELGPRARDQVDLRADELDRVLRALRLPADREVRAAAAVWSECVRCPSFPNCQETALIRSVDREASATDAASSLASRRKLTSAGRSTGRSVDLEHAVGPTLNDRLALWECSRRGSKHIWSVSASASLTAWLMLATEPRMAIVWDEGYTLGREEGLRDWFRALRDPPDSPPTGSLDRRTRNWFSDHPATPPPRPRQLDSRSQAALRPRRPGVVLAVRRGRSRMVIPRFMPARLGRGCSCPVWQELPRARLGPILLFSLTAGAIFSFLATPVGLLAGGSRGGELGPSAESVRPRSLRGL